MSTTTTTPTQSVSDPRAVSRDIFSATIGSVCCCYTGQPFDTVKVRMQTNPTMFSGVAASTMSILRHEGISVSDESIACCGCKLQHRCISPESYLDDSDSIVMRRFCAYLRCLLNVTILSFHNFLSCA